MKVKGVAIKTTRDFVKTNFPGNYKGWIDSLKPEARKVYSETINATEWYLIKEYYLDVINAIAKMFFNGNIRKCGDALGYYSAEIALKGFYKVFLLVASPTYLIQRATKIVTTYYQPSAVEIVILDSKSAGLKITRFDVIDEALEFRFGGWCKRALELSNCKGVNYTINSSIAKGDEYTEIIFTWD